MRIDSPFARAATRWIVAGWTLPSSFADAGSQIYRCVDGERVTYTDRGCSEQGEVVAIAVSTATMRVAFQDRRVMRIQTQ